MAGPFGGALRGLMPKDGGSAMAGSVDWTYVAGIVALLAITS